MRMQKPFDYKPETGDFISTHAIVDLPAIVIAIIITLLLVKGIKESV